MGIICPSDFLHAVTQNGQPCYIRRADVVCIQSSAVEGTAIIILASGLSLAVNGTPQGWFEQLIARVDN